MIVREDDDDHRVEIVAWGKHIMKSLSERSTCAWHPFRSDATDGRGWVEVYFIVDGNGGGEEMVLPKRHVYYEGHDLDLESDYSSSESDDSISVSESDYQGSDQD